MIKVVENFYHKTIFKMRFRSGQKTGDITVTEEVLEEDPLGLVLFNILLHDMEDFFVADGHMDRKLKMNLLLFADDEVFVEDDITKAQHLLYIFDSI